MLLFLWSSKMSHGKKKSKQQRGPARMEHVFQFRRWSSLCILWSWHFSGGSGLWTVLLQARLWAEGKRYVILMTTSQGSRGSGRQELFFSQLYRWQLKALRGWVACWRFMIWKGASCWDVDPGLLHSKSINHHTAVPLWVLPRAASPGGLGMRFSALFVAQRCSSS